MLTVTKKAAALLKAAKAAEGATPESGIRIRRGSVSDDSGERAVAVGFSVSDAPNPGDAETEQNGLRIFVEDSLIETLDGRTLDVWNEGDEGPELVFR
jgi:Fe-S cluster assembly iron-binding protein IscA